MNKHVRNGLLFATGIGFGFAIADFTSGASAGLSGILPSLAFSIGAKTIHIHHWLWASASMVTLFVAHKKKQVFRPTMIWVALGLLAGISLQGISQYNDWHRIVYTQVMH